MNTQTAAIPAVGSTPLFGLWDGRDQCWLGNESGPLVYEEKLMAQLAATISTERLGRWVLPRVLVGYGKKKDDITPRISAEEAIRRIESRCPNTSVSGPCPPTLDSTSKSTVSGG
jgi:hypothetical protein